MRKLIGIEFVKMRRFPVVWLVALISTGAGIYYALMDFYAQTLIHYPQVEYIIFIRSGARWFSMAAVFLTAYTIAGDFSMRTVLNVLSAGIDRRKYYFSRLAAQELFFFALYVCGNLVYVVSRILFTGKYNTTLPVQQLALLILVMALQVCAYVAVANLIGLCCKKQALSVLVGEICLFLTIVFRLYGMGADYYRNTGSYHMLSGPIAFEPLYVMECVDYYLLAYDSLFCFGFLKYALSAAVIIVAAGAAGYFCMMRSDFT